MTTSPPIAAPAFPETRCAQAPFTLTHVVAPAGQPYPGSPDPKLNDLHVRVEHDAFQGESWNVWAPESFLGKGHQPYTGFRPVLGMTWRAGHDALRFDRLPYRANIDLDVSAVIRIESADSIVYTVTVTNSTDRAIEAVHFNACFNHRRTATFGKDVFVHDGRDWKLLKDLGDVPAPGIPYFLLDGKTDLWQDARQEREHFPVYPSLRPPLGIIATTGTDRAGHDYTLAHASPSAALVWNNVNHPCTDLWPWFGTIAPGATRAAAGRLYFFKGKRCFDRVLERFNADAWEAGEP